MKKVKDYSKERNRVNTYYEVGKLLNDAGKHYGDGIIKKYSIKLSNDIGRRYDVTSLKRMRKFYCLIQKGAPLAHQLMWSHYIELLPLKDINAIKYYIDECIKYNLSRNELREKIKNKEYERLPKGTKDKLISKKNNKYILAYTSDKRILSKEYILI